LLQLVRPVFEIVCVARQYSASEGTRAEFFSATPAY
jgi:hypothetical protein